jgi:hypothetical protein
MLLYDKTFTLMKNYWCIGITFQGWLHKIRSGVIYALLRDFLFSSLSFFFFLVVWGFELRALRFVGRSFYHLSHAFRTFFVCLFVFILKAGSLCVAQAVLELAVLLPLSPQYWDYRGIPPYLA